MSLSLIILLLFLIVFTLGFIYIEPMISKQKINNKNEYGSARFSSLKEIKNNFTKEKISNIKEAGIPIWYDKNLKYVWFDKETPHYVYLGSSNSGKSVTAVIPMISFIATAKKKRSVFITDPKGEIYEKTSKMLKDNGYEVLTLDFRNPSLSNHINLLEPIIKEYDKYIEYENRYNKATNIKDKTKYNNLFMTSYAEANRLISSISMMIMSDKENKDPFWSNSAKNLLEGLISFFLEEYKDEKIKREQVTMTNIRKLQNSTMSKVNSDKFKEYIEKKDYGVKSKDNLIPILSTSENTYKSIVSVFSEKMAIFDDINVANVTSKSDFDINMLGSKPAALYVIVPDEDKLYYILVTIIVGILYKELVKLASSQGNKKLPIEIDWIMDEFANCPPLADIEAMVSVARSRGMRFHFFIQSLSQLNNVYGKEVSQIILDNAGLQYLKTNTMSTAEEISKRLGKKTIEANSISQSISLLNYNGNQSVSLMSRDLLTPNEVKGLHYKTIIFPNIGYPIFRDTVMYEKLSCYSKGTVKRNVDALVSLSNNYYTVEDINSSKKEELFNNEDNIYNNLEMYQKKLFSPAIKIIEDVLNSKIETIEYKKYNERIYAFCVLNKELNTKELTLIKGKINKNIFHLEINQKKFYIEIHLKKI